MYQIRNFVGSVARTAILLAVAWAVLPAVVQASEPTLHWPVAVVEWHYNGLGKPVWLGEEEALELAQQAAAGWRACGIALRYAGESDAVPGNMDGRNVVGWAGDGRRHSAWTHWSAKRSGALLEADITLYANVFDDYRARGMDARLELNKSLVHEFGHVLGLTHSEVPSDAMSVRVRTRPEWKLPSENDIARCRGHYGYEN